MPETVPCRSCGAPMIWVKMVKTGKANPLDAEPTENGNVTVDCHGIGTVLSGVGLDAARMAKIPLRLSHFATCPNAKQHRKPKEDADAANGN